MTRLEIFRRGYLAPFQCVFRNLIYISGFLGCLGFSGASIFFVFDLGGYGLPILFAFFLSRYIASNFILMPGALFFIQRFWGLHIFLALISLSAISAISALFLLKLEAGSYLYAFCGSFLFSLISVTFWSFHHVCMLFRTTDDNVGNEVSICGFCDGLGSAAGLFLGGLVLSISLSGGILIFFMAMFLATLCLLFVVLHIDPPDRKTPYHPIKNILNTDLDHSAMTAFHGVIQFFCVFSAPVWLAMLGAKSLLTGFLMGLNILLEFITSPFIGHIFHQDKKHEAKIGAALLATGWLPLTVFQNAFLFPLASMFWLIGENMLHVGNIGRWYRNRDIASIAAREILLGSGRIAACLTALPILFYTSPFWFFIFAACACLCAFLFFLKKNKN